MPILFYYHIVAAQNLIHHMFIGCYIYMLSKNTDCQLIEFHKAFNYLLQLGDEFGV